MAEGTEAQNERWTIFVCEGCGRQVHETYEYKHDECEGGEEEVEVVRAQTTNEPCASAPKKDANQRPSTPNKSDPGTEDSA